MEIERTIKDIIDHYASDLKKGGFLSKEEYKYHTKQPEGRSEILELLLEKLYETEERDGKVGSSLDAFYHFCNYIVYKDPASGTIIWNHFIEELFLIAEYNQLVAIMAPRGHGKSFFAYALYPLFKSFLFTYFDAVLVSNIPKMNKRNFRVLKRIIESNELLIQKIDYKGNERVKWTEDEISYNKGMLEGISIGSTPRSAHVRYIIGDDPLRDDGRYTDDYYKNFFLGQSLPVIQRFNGRMLLFGTPQHFEDLFHVAMNTKVDDSDGLFRPQGELVVDGTLSDLGFCSKVFKAINETTGKVLLPEIFDRAKLEKIRRTQGEILFQREYMCECVADKTAVFPYKLIRRVMNNEERMIEKGIEGRDYFIGVDVATSGQASADFSAFVVMEARYEDVKGTDDDGEEAVSNELIKIVKYIYHVKGLEVDEQVKMVANLAAQFNDAFVLVEQNNVGVALIQRLKYMGTNVDSFVTNKFKKENAIRMVLDDMRNRRFKMPKTGKNILKLKDELSKFGVKRIKTRGGSTKERMQALSAHDDLVMALLIASEAVEEYGTGSTLFICQD